MVQKQGTRGYFNSILDTIGDTPLVRLAKISGDIVPTIFGKAEYFNPGSSVKDRIGFAMIHAAEQEGIIHPGDTIVEPTSGNTGIGLSVACAVKGYSLIICMPESMSIERQRILKAYGAVVELTPAGGGMNAAIERAMEIKESGRAKFIPQQFKNKANPDIHYRTTGPEILNALDGKVDVLVAAVGTGGTIMGVGRYLREKLGDAIRIVAVEPEKSPVLSGGDPGPHGIQGMGAGFIPDIVDTDLFDDIHTVTLDEAIAMARILARQEGIFVGMSAGANVAIAHEIGRSLGHPANIVTILCDTGERYLSNEIWKL
ncbi:cysteine synthase A [Candidatus Bathyarchaeota archaeon]|nr:cysteine synthase A [Candidatus Bathyarchaeota archaeon]